MTAPRVLPPLYAAGFVTAFGAHAVAANLGGYAEKQATPLIGLGILLALYDLAEVVLKPVFGGLADRVGPRPVLLGGLLGFALTSLAFVAAGNPGLLALARFGQGASAAAFSPATGALVAIHGGGERRGRSFGGYGAAKSLGYLLGPVVGGALVAVAGYPLLFAVLGATAIVVALAVAVVVPHTPALPKKRETIAGLIRRIGDPTFLRPVAALAGVTAALSTGIGFLPVIGLRAHLSPVITGAGVSALALTSTIVQIQAGRALDEGRLVLRTGLVAGLLAAAAGFVVGALLPGVVGILAAAALIGVGVGLATPLGYAALAANSPPERLGVTMGTAEVGIELGDAGGPLLVGVLTPISLGAGFFGLAATLAALAVASVRTGSKKLAPETASTE